MFARNLISDLVIPLKPTDTGEMALTWMDELRLAHLPVVDNEKFLGLITDTIVYNLDDPGQPINKQRPALIRPYVIHDQHFYDVIKLAAEENLSVVPVLDQKENYLGCITLFAITKAMAEIASAKQPGGIIILEVTDHNYSLSEISRIVESNDAKILSTYITSFTESTRIEVTIKMNKIDISPVIQTFNRYNYNVVASFSEESQYGDLLNDRYESLMKYLNI